jgi:hypothetical protein
MAAAAGGRPHHHMRKALKAQQRCRLTFKILQALRAVAPECSNSSEQTIGESKSFVRPIAYDRGEASTAKAPAPASSPAPGPSPRRHLIRRSQAGRKAWSPERRARQALAIRTWQPSQESTGPRTQAGKTRSAGNARRHGLRSRGHIERLREDRRILARSACTIALGRQLLGTILAHRNRPSQPRLSPNWYWPMRPRADTVSPANSLGLAAPAAPAAGGFSRFSRRRWRLAS